MKAREPTPEEIQDLVAFLPRPYAEGLDPVPRWHIRVEGQNGPLTALWVEHHEVVKESLQA